MGTQNTELYQEQAEQGTLSAATQIKEFNEQQLWGIYRKLILKSYKPREPLVLSFVIKVLVTGWKRGMLIMCHFDN